MMIVAGCIGNIVQLWIYYQ